MMQWDGIHDMHQECIKGHARKPQVVRKSFWLDDLLNVLRRVEIRGRRGYARLVAWIDEVWLPRAMERITGKAADRVCAWGLVAVVTMLAVYLLQWGARGFSVR